VLRILTIRRSSPEWPGSWGLATNRSALGQAGRGECRQSSRADHRGAGRAEAAPQGELRAPAVQRRPAGSSDFLRGGARPPTKEVVAFIDAHRNNETGGRRWGVEPICTELAVAPSTYYDAQSRPPSARAVRDAELGPKLVELWKHNYSVYGRRKLTKVARRAGHDVGRDQVARLMRHQGIRGASRSKKRFTTKSDPTAVRAPDLVNRNFTASRPDALWVADFTYCSTWSGVVYVAFIIDVYSRRLVG
jgi:putative transposase